MDRSPPGPAAGDLRRCILEQATRAFAERGFAGTSIRHLVEACGCTRPSLYYYFDSKAALFLEVVEQHVDAHRSLIEGLLASSGAVRQRVHHVVDEFVEYMRAHPCGMRLLQRIETQSEQGAPRVNLSAARNLHLEMLAGLLEQGIAAGEIASGVVPLEGAMVLAGAISLQCEIALSDGRWDPERIHRTIDLVFDGIGSR